MRRATVRSRLERLEQLTSYLKTQDRVVLKDVADELGVSLRSVSRDVQILRDRGLPIEADRGRGGGVRLRPRWGIGRIALSYREALNLLIGIAITEQMEAPLFMGSVAPVRRKLVATFGADDQRRIRMLRERLRVGPVSSPAVLAGFVPGPAAIAEKLQESFLLMRIAEVIYRAADDSETTREIEPHYLVLNYPVWYALCWDHLRKGIRTLRADRISAVRVLNRTFAPRPFSDFESAMSGNEVIVP